MKIHKLFFLVISILLASCNGDDEIKLPPKYVPKGAFDSGVLVLNQGNATTNATISYISLDLGVLKNNILSGISSNPSIGANATDVGLIGDLAYIVSSTDNKIEIVNRYTMAKIGTISNGFANPKYIAFANGKAFVTNWGNPTIATDDFIAVIDLNNNLVINSIPVAEGPGHILSNNGKLYIAQTGGDNLGNKVIVVNASNNSVAYINVANEPNTMQIDNGKLWVLCEGNRNSGQETTGGLVEININSNTYSQVYEFPTRLTDPNVPTSTVIYQHPTNLQISGTDVIYTKSNAIYKMSLVPQIVGKETVPRVIYPTEPKFNLSFTNISCYTSKGNYLYFGGYNSINSSGFVNIYSNGNQDLGIIGTLLKTQTVGIAPAGFYFNQ